MAKKKGDKKQYSSNISLEYQIFWSGNQLLLNKLRVCLHLFLPT
jgi:hypothetical protein